MIFNKSCAIVIIKQLKQRSYRSLKIRRNRSHNIGILLNNLEFRLANDFSRSKKDCGIYKR